jgi:alpha-L-arabinofuranosidase
LLNASQLVEWIRLGLPVADRQLVAAEVPPASHCCAKLPEAAPYATTGGIGTPGPRTVLEATGEVYNLFAAMAGGRVLPSATLHNPVLATVGRQAVGTLLVLAGQKGQDLYLVGINRSPTKDVSTRLVLDGSAVKRAGVVARLDGASALSYNTVTAPQSVRLTIGALQETGSHLTVTFPAHSVTALRLQIAPVRA